jgi:hypothetical protein
MLSPRRYPTSLPDQREGRAQADSGKHHPPRRVCREALLNEPTSITKAPLVTRAEGAVGCMQGWAASFQSVIQRRQ